MLRGKRVVLRAIEKEDIKRLHELYANIDLVLLGHGVWRPESLAAWEKDFDKRLEDHDKADFVIEVDGVVIGEIDLQSHHMNRRAGVAHLGVGIYDPEYVGKGYGRDSINTLLDWSFRILNLRRVALETLATNERAIRAYHACGFVEEGRLREHEYVDGEYVDIVVMGVLRSEWEISQRD
jgi:RimJ/RimL family protein N-acetyltransferase